MREGGRGKKIKKGRGGLGGGGEGLRQQGLEGLYDCVQQTPLPQEGCFSQQLSLENRNVSWSQIWSFELDYN